jgi:ferredoxin
MVMRVVLDLVKCNGYGSCVIAAPEVFRLNATGDLAEVIDEHPDDVLRAAVMEAARVCPKRAIAVMDDEAIAS